MTNLRSVNRHLLVTFASVLTSTIILFFCQPVKSVFAASPIVTVCRYNPAANCIDAIRGSFDLDTFTRDALAGEIFSFWAPEAIKANAVLIRSGALYYVNNPLSNAFPSCSGTNFPFTLHTYTYQGWELGKGATIEGTGSNIPDDRVTDTQAEILRKNGQLFFPSFNDCLQYYTRDLAAANPPRNYVTILTSSTEGVYAPTPAANCGLASQSNLSITGNNYSFLRSMTNGTVPTALVNGSYSSAVTSVGVARQTDVYWGHAGLDLVLDNPFGQSGRYVAGWHTGDKVEFLMQFGGAYQYLYLIGISDKPGPIILNIYIDGYYKQTMQWNHNDNARHLTTRGFGTGYPFGTHAIAIEFANDTGCNPFNPDCDRNFYFDVLSVMNIP